MDTSQQSAGEPVTSTPEFTATFKHRKTLVDGNWLHNVVGGCGPAVVLIHGFPQTWYMWRKIMLPLAEDYTVLASDMRGCGDSDKPEDGYDAQLRRCRRRARGAGSVPRCLRNRPTDPTARHQQAVNPGAGSQRRVRPPDVAGEMKQLAEHVHGGPISGSGHFIAEEKPDHLLESLHGLFAEAEKSIQ